MQVSVNLDINQLGPMDYLRTESNGQCHVGELVLKASKVDCDLSPHRPVTTRLEGSITHNSDTKEKS